MYSQTVNIPAGQTLSVGLIIPASVKNVMAQVTSGRALLNEVESNRIAWVNPNALIHIKSLMDCTVEISEQDPESSGQ